VFTQHHFVNARGANFKLGAFSVGSRCTNDTTPDLAGPPGRNGAPAPERATAVPPTSSEGAMPRKAAKGNRSDTESATCR
jgi:hypothetical protein